MLDQMTPVNREKLLDELDGQTPPEWFELLDTRTQNTLRQAFSASLDLADVEELAFCVKDNTATRVGELSLRIDGQWDSFLNCRDLRNEYAHEIERNYLEQFGEE